MHPSFSSGTPGGCFWSDLYLHAGESLAKALWDLHLQGHPTVVKEWVLGGGCLLFSWKLSYCPLRGLPQLLCPGIYRDNSITTSCPQMVPSVGSTTSALGSLVFCFNFYLDKLIIFMLVAVFFFPRHLLWLCFLPSP